MIVIAVEGLDVDACFTHQSRELAELARFPLIQALHEHLPFGEDANAGSLQRGARGRSIVEEEVSNALTVPDKRAAALNAYARASQRFAHLSQRAGPVFERNCKILHCEIRLQTIQFLGRV